MIGAFIDSQEHNLKATFSLAEVNVQSAMENPIHENKWSDDVELWQILVSVVLLIILAIVFLVSVLANTLSILIILKKRRLRSPANRFLLNLIVASLLSGVTLSPLLSADILTSYWPHLQQLCHDSSVLCVSLDIVATFCIVTMVSATLLVAIDRYSAVSGALRYRANMTSYRVVVAILFGWIAAAVITAISAVITTTSSHHLHHQHAATITAHAITSVLTAVELVIPMAALIWMYASIYQCAHRSGKKQRQNSSGSWQASVLTAATAAALSESCQRNAAKRSQSLRLQSKKGSAEMSLPPLRRSTSSIIVTTIKHKFSNASEFMYREEARTARVSVAVIGTSLICWTPFFVDRHISMNLAYPPAVLKHLVLLLLVLHTALTPFLYIFRTNRGRRDLRNFLATISICKSQRQPSKLTKFDLKQVPTVSALVSRASAINQKPVESTECNGNCANNAELNINDQSINAETTISHTTTLDHIINCSPLLESMTSEVSASLTTVVSSCSDQ